MKASLSYQEIEKLIREKVGKEIRVSYENSKTIKVAYDINTFFTTKTVELYIKVVQVNPTSVRLKYYSSGFAVEKFAVEKIISYFLKTMKSDIYSLNDNETELIFYLEKLNGSAEIAFRDMISLGDITFSDEGAEVVISLK